MAKSDATEDTKIASEGAVQPTARKRGRSNREFPAGTFDEALEFAKQVYECGSGQPVRRLTLFNEIKRAPESSMSRMLITNSNKYGLLKGSKDSEELELTAEGKRACDDNTSPRESAKIKAKMAISDVPTFSAVYEKFVNVKLPPRAALLDALKEAGVPSEHVEEGADTFIVNLKSVGLLQTLSGAERVVSVDHMLDGLPSTTGRKSSSNLPQSDSTSSMADTVLRNDLITQDQAAFEATCFYITPIGNDDSETRKHSNLFLENIVEPAIKTVGLSVVRADQIDKPGVITRQIIEYILKSRLVIADLSFSNANVFYELALRHASRLPSVQIIRYGDPIPFDINQMRTIIIDNRDIYSLLPNVELYRSEIANQARRALEAGADVDTPISIYFPQAKLSF